MNNAKVFCIGFHKTGTTTLAVALTELGYNVTGPNGINDSDISANALPMAFDLVKRYDAFQDNPWPVIFKDVDTKFPGSKFILTVRTPESWIKSQVAHFGTRTTAMREWIYGAGCPEGNEAIYLDRYNNHNKEVMEYFNDRPDDLLAMDLSQSDGWDEICAFLGKEIPDTPFPHANSANDRVSKKKSLLQRILVYLRS
jgi:hypothetical protein